MRRLNEMGLRIPEDISIISFNNVLISELSSPPMSTVDINIFGLGHEATNLLIEKIQQPTLEPRNIIIPHKLIKRQTCNKLIVKKKLN